MDINGKLNKEVTFVVAGVRGILGTIRKNNLLFIFALLFILSSSFVSAELFTWDNWKLYNENLKEATVRDLDGKIGSITLETPLNFKVKTGYQKVAQFKINSYENYDNILNNIAFYNKNKLFWEKNSISLKYDLKYLTYEDIIVKDSYTKCDPKSKEIINCWSVSNGSHTEKKEVWNDLDKISLRNKENITIGIFTNVESGDYVEWIPKIYGLDINEWASWMAIDIYSPNNETVGGMDSDSSPSPFVCSSSNQWNSDCYNAFDGDESTFSGFGDDPNGWIKIDMGSGNEFYLTNLTLSVYGTGTTIVKDGYLEGSNDDSSWVRLISISSNPNVIGNYTYSNSSIDTAYRYYKLTETDNYGGGSAGIFEIYLFGGYNISTGLSINMNNPSDEEAFNISSVNFDCNATSSVGIYELNLSIDGILEEQVTGDGTTNLSINKDVTLSDGSHNYTCSAYDDVSNSSQTYDFSIDTTPFIELISPTPDNSSNWTEIEIPIYVNISTPYFDNVTYDLYYENGTIKESQSYDTEVYNHNFTNCFCGNYNYNVTVCTTTDQCNYTETRFINVDVEEPNINITSPLEYYPFLDDGDKVNLNYTVVDDESHLDTCWYYYPTEEILSTANYSEGTSWNILNGSMLGGGDAPLLNIGLIEGLPRYTISGIADGLSDFSETIPNCVNETYYAFRDTSFLENDKYFCVKSDDRYYLIKQVSVGGSPIIPINGTSIAYNSTKNVNCSGSSSFDYKLGFDYLTFFANDTFGNLNSVLRDWSFLFDDYSISYDNETYEGVQNTFTTNFVLTSSEDSISQSLFEYNNTNYTTNIDYSGGEYTISSTINAPIINEDDLFNFTFYYYLDGSIYQLSNYNQTVYNINLTECTAGDDELITLLLVDEETQEAISGDIETNMQIYSKDNDYLIESLELNETSIENISICLNPSESFDNYYLNGEIRYESSDHVAEFYMIQNADLDDYPINLTLYDLSSNESTEFLITYKDDNLITVEDAVVQLQRKYISEDLFKVVEAPLTGSDGTAVVHIDLNTNLYKATVVKDSVVLDIFDNLVFNCENELSGICEETLSGEINPQNSISLETLQDFSYSISNVDNDITLTYSIPSGTASNVGIYMVQRDIYGNETMCNETITSTGGSLTCSYDETFGDSVINIEVRKSDNLIASKSYIAPEDTTLDFLNNNYLIVFILILSVTGMAFSSPEWIILNAVLTMLLSGSIWLINGLDFVMGLGSLMWLLVAGIILIFKITKQEDR